MERAVAWWKLRRRALKRACGRPNRWGGYRRLIGGIAIASTSNGITVDRDAGNIVYTQRNRVGGERTQSLPLATVAAVVLREQRLLSGSSIQRHLSITVLGLQISDGGFWIVDSAVDPRELDDLKRALEDAVDKTP
ncbi:hypothetical protein HC891_26490 [Candidatus Gracilibacteria bacterium]|nr:hypothetical protein [Candidatus Gracilibacteria bacterium]